MKTETIVPRICSTCKWKYETEHSIGCNNPSPDRDEWAEYHHVYEPCGIWETKDNNYER